MSRKGGQNKVKDGGALSDPHVGPVKSDFQKEVRIFQLPEEGITCKAGIVGDTFQNGEGSSSDISISTSGGIKNISSVSSLLEPLDVAAGTEWLKNKLDDGDENLVASDEKVKPGIRTLDTVFPVFNHGGIFSVDGGSLLSLSAESAPHMLAAGKKGMQQAASGQGSKEITSTESANSESNELTSKNSAIDSGSSSLDCHMEPSKPVLYEDVVVASTDELDLGEFDDFSESNKNNAFLSAQELDTLPDECLDLEEHMDTSVDDMVKKIWANTSNVSNVPIPSSDPLHKDTEANKPLMSNVISGSEFTCTSSQALKMPVCQASQSLLASHHKTSYSSTSDVNLLSPAVSTSQAPLKVGSETSSNVTSANGLPANCTLATIYISTDKGANSTQICVNAGGSQQMYQLNTASLTGAVPMATVVQNGLPQAPPTQDTSKANGSVTDGLTGYLLLPVGQAEASGILMSVPLGTVTKSVEQGLEPGEVPSGGQSYDVNTKTWYCHEDGCGKAFKKQSKLRIHQMRHTGERPFKCDREGCGWAFTTAYKLRRHQESHQGRKDYVCDIDGCQRKFTTIYNLNSHRRLHARPCNEVCPEPGCGERFHTKRRLDLHLKNHEGAEKNYKCPVAGCDKVFFSPNCMGSHARVHQQEKEDLTCKFEGCGKTFEKQCRLKQHMRSHTGEKPYVCSYEGCGWAFTTASKLTRHMNKHTGERKWECPIEGCGKAFMRAEHLKGHILSHSGVRPFVCPVEGCNSRFSAKSSLYVHLKKHDHSGEKIVYFCPMQGCVKKYSTKSCLRNHITKHYSTNVSDSDHAHFDLVPLLAGDDLPEASLDTFPNSQGESINTPVSAVDINTSISASLLGTSDPVLISPSDYIATGVEQTVMAPTAFSSDSLTQQLSSNMVTQYIVTGDLQSSGVFSGALLGVPPTTLTVPGNPGEICASCGSSVCSCNHPTETQSSHNNKHKTKVSIGKTVSQCVLQENTSGSARTDYKANHFLSDRAKKRRLNQKDKLDVMSLPIPTGLIVNDSPLSKKGADGMCSSSYGPSDVLTSQGITYRDPDTGTTYVQTQLLQDDPPNPEMYPDDSSLASVTLHDPSPTDVTSEFTGTTINLQDLE